MVNQSQFIEMSKGSNVTMKLGELFELIRNGANIKQGVHSGGYPITRIETIADGFVDRTKMGFAGITDGSFAGYYLKDNDILMSHINSMKHIGKSAIYKALPGEVVIHGMNLLCLRLKENKANPIYVLYLLQSDKIREEIRLISKQAVNQASFTVSDLKSIRCELPCLDVQKAFEGLVQRADKSKFAGFKSQFIEETKRWSTRSTIGGLVEVNIAKAGKMFEAESTIQYIDISSVDNATNTVLGATEYIFKDAPSRAQQCIKAGDILVSTVRPNLKNIAVNHLSGDNLVASSGFCVLRPKDGYTGLLLAYILSDEFTEKMTLVAKGTNYPAVHDSDILDYEITVPEKDEVKRIDSLYRQADKSKYLN